MRAWWHWVLAVLGAVVAVVLLSAGALAYLVLRLDVRGEVERAVESATGRDLVISGPVGVSFWPVLGLHASNASLANVAGGRAPAFIVADDIHIGVEIPPLLNRQVVVRQLVLQHPRIALELDANGRPNWTLAPTPRPAPAAPAPAAPPAASAPSAAPMIDAARTTLREVDISGGEVSYYDARHGSGWAVGNVNLTTALTALDQPMRVRGVVTYNDKPVQVDMTIAKPGQAMRAQASPLTLNLQGELISAAFDGQTMALSGELDGTVHATGSSLRQLAAWVGAPFQGGVGLEHFDITGRVGFGGGEFAFSNAGFVVDQVAGRGDFTLMERRGKPYLSGRLELFDVDLNPYLTGRAPSGQPPPTPAPAAPATAPAPAGPQAPTAQIAASPPPSRAVDVAAPATATPIDFSFLHAFNADLELVTHAVLVSHARIESGRITLVLNDGYLAATMESMALYGGSGHGRFEIDAREPDAHIVQDMAFDHLDALRFLSDAANFSNIEGTSELTFTLRTHGASQHDLIANADGRIHVEVVSGVLHGVDLGGVARTISNALRGELIAPEARTPFLGFSANFAVAHGALASDDLSFNTTALRIPGVGVIDLNNRRLDLRISPRPPRGGIAIPFSIRGPFGALTYNSDIGGSALHDIQNRVHAVQTAAPAP